jgi:hypothetical protein
MRQNFLLILYLQKTACERVLPNTGSTPDNFVTLGELLRPLTGFATLWPACNTIAAVFFRATGGEAALSAVLRHNLWF